MPLGLPVQVKSSLLTSENNFLFVFFVFVLFSLKVSISVVLLKCIILALHNNWLDDTKIYPNKS